MAQLIQMRQRIKAIETIKKITHAMRLISMSMHSRLRNKTPLLKKYNTELTSVFKKLRSISPKWQNAITSPKESPESKSLFIIAGSQKGLCGTFNSGLFKEFEEIIKQEDIKKIEFICIGKKAYEHLKAHQFKLIKNFDNINMRNFTKISNEITKLIIDAEQPYSSIKILSNELKSFFFQKPKLNQLTPLIEENIDEKIDDNQNYIWYQDAEEMLDQLVPQYLASNINSILLESLLSEQAARFLSMDAATRNAKKLLEETTLQYNKLRQAKITKELTELASNFE